MITTIDTIKKKYKAITHKKSFVEELALELELNATYLTQHYFQAGWKIPADKMELINTRLDSKIKEQIAELKAI